MFCSFYFFFHGKNTRFPRIFPTFPSIESFQPFRKLLLVVVVAVFCAHHKLPSENTFLKNKKG